MADGRPVEIELDELIRRTLDRSGPTFSVAGPVPTGMVSAITQDSRAVVPGSIFGAVRGETADGLDFVADAVDRGAVGIIAREDRTGSVTTLVTADTRALIGVMASELHRNPSSRLDLIGVTGTNGKTSIVTLFEHVADYAGRRARSLGTLTSGLTTSAAPDFQATLASAVEDGIEVVAAEVSSHALDQHRVDGSEFRLAIFTNLSQDHLDYHGDLDSYFEAKARLFAPELARIGIVDIATPAGKRLVDRAEIPVVAVDSSALEDVELTAHECRFRWRDHTVVLPLAGRFNIANALLVAEAAVEIGIEPAVVVQALATAPQIPGRFEYVDAGQPFSVVVDYSHTPASLDAAISAAREVATGTVVVVFGAAGDRDPGKRPLMGAAASAADRLFATSDNPRSEDPELILDAVVAGIDHADVHRITDRRQAIADAIGGAVDGDIVLIAGKGHEDYQIVGERVVDFDDRVVAREVLAELGWVAAA